MDNSTARVEGAKHGAERSKSTLRLEGNASLTAMHQREQALAQKDVLLTMAIKAHGSGTGRRVEAKLHANCSWGCSIMHGGGLNT